MGTSRFVAEKQKNMRNGPLFHVSWPAVLQTHEGEHHRLKQHGSGGGTKKRKSQRFRTSGKTGALSEMLGRGGGERAGILLRADEGILKSS